MTPACAWARSTSPVGLFSSQDVGILVAVVVGVPVSLLSVVLGILAWTTAAKAPKSIGGVLARGTLGVSSVLAFICGGLCLGLGFQPGRGAFAAWPFVLVLVLAPGFLAVEFFIAASLYGKLAAARPTTSAKLLRGVSLALGGLFAIVSVVLIAVVVLSSFIRAFGT